MWDPSVALNHAISLVHNCRILLWSNTIRPCSRMSGAVLLLCERNHSDSEKDINDQRFYSVFRYGLIRLTHIDFCWYAQLAILQQPHCIEHIWNWCAIIHNIHHLKCPQQIVVDLGALGQHKTSAIGINWCDIWKRAHSFMSCNPPNFHYFIIYSNTNRATDSTKYFDRQLARCNSSRIAWVWDDSVASPSTKSQVIFSPRHCGNQLFRSTPIENCDHRWSYFRWSEFSKQRKKTHVNFVFAAIELLWPTNI